MWRWFNIKKHSIAQLSPEHVKTQATKVSLYISQINWTVRRYTMVNYQLVMSERAYYKKAYLYGISSVYGIIHILSSPQNAKGA